MGAVLASGMIEGRAEAKAKLARFWKRMSDSASVAGAAAAGVLTIRSERQLMEQLQYNMLYRWFVGLGVDDPVWVPTVFSKNRDRLLEAEVARRASFYPSC